MSPEYQRLARWLRGRNLTDRRHKRNVSVMRRHVLPTFGAGTSADVTTARGRSRATHRLLPAELPDEIKSHPERYAAPGRDGHLFIGPQDGHCDGAASKTTARPGRPQTSRPICTDGEQSGDAPTTNRTLTRQIRRRNLHERLVPAALLRIDAVLLEHFLQPAPVPPAPGNELPVTMCAAAEGP